VGSIRILGLEKIEVATSVAFAVHKQLENEGFDTESDAYYSEIDKRVRHRVASQDLTWKRTRNPSKQSLQPHATHRLDANKIVSS
jgi:hypothetical protein